MQRNKKLSLTLFYREPRKTGLSIEGIFHSVRDCLSESIDIKEHYCVAGESRMKNTRAAAAAASEINHITGDVNFLAIGLRKHKTILTIHDLGFYENPVHSPLVRFVYRLFWFTLPLRYVSLVTVVSEFTKEKLIRYFKYPESRIRVVPDPVKKVFRYVPKEALNKVPVVLMMGTGKHKNLDGLIEAAKDGGFHLDIVGWPSADELARLDGYKISYKVYNGLTDEEVLERYIACDIMFMASFYEGFGMPIIEAQCVGRPVVTSNIGAMLEVGKGSALLVDPHRPEAIREAMLSLLNRELYDEVVVRGRENAARYDYKKIAEQYLSIYEALAVK